MGMEVRSYTDVPLDISEILRYAGMRGNDPTVDALLRECLNEVEGRLIYKVGFSEFVVTQEKEKINLGFMCTSSQTVKKRLCGCERMVVFAATVGMEIDRLIARYSSVSPTKALLFQAIGTERIESLCERFAQEIQEQKAKEGFLTTPRFSPGYGDFPLAAQKNVFAVLDCPKRMGLTLNESLLMSPSKSVTALIGISRNDRNVGE